MHDAIPSLLHFPNLAFSWVLIGTIGSRLVFLDAELLDRLHEEGVWSNLGSVPIECELFGHSKVRNEVLERLAHLVPGHCLEMIALGETTSMRVDLGGLSSPTFSGVHIKKL